MDLHYPKLYIAGPISQGDFQHNKKQAMEAYHKAMEAKFATVCPHVTMYLLELKGELDWKSFSWKHWLENDLPWVRCADAIFRLPGKSRGGDMEVVLGMESNVAIYYDMELLIGDRDLLPRSKSRPPVDHPEFME